MATRGHPNGHKRSNGVSHIGGVLDGAEALIAATAEKSEHGVGDLRHSLEGDLAAARSHLEKLEADLKKQVGGVDKFVHANPWQAVGVSAGAGVLAGVFVGAVAFRR